MIAISRPSLGKEELDAVGEVFGSGWLGLGATTLEFEEEVKRYVGCAHLVAVNSGTSALHIALSAFGIGPGDEVIVPSITFAASVQAILATGATPVFCESAEQTLLIDLEDVARRITSRTRAVMPVHLYGGPCDMDGLLALAESHRFWVIEDAAHAFGSADKGRRLGSFGHATCFSFDPIKNITCGEGGAVALADPVIAEEIRRRRVLGFDTDTWGRAQHGPNAPAEVVSEGFRYHMPNFCAAIGLAQMRKLDGFLRRRRAICRRYADAFRDLRHVRVRPVDYDDVAPHSYVVRVPAQARTEFMRALAARGVGTGVHYVANHVQPYFAPYATVPLPVSSRLCREIVSLPLHCEMTDDDVRTVIGAVVEWDTRLEAQ